VISWKNSFKRLNEEYELAKKKKQAVDNLYITGKISQFTRDSFNKDISTTIVEVERQQKDLLVKMQLKSDELAIQITTLESLLANYEIQYVVGEIEESSYQRDSLLLTAGLDAAKNELETIKQATMQLCAPVPTIQAPATPDLPVAESTIGTPTISYVPTHETATVETAPLEAPVESPLMETNSFEATTATIEETPEEQTFTAEVPIIEESVESTPFEVSAPIFSAETEESVMESAPFEEASVVEESAPIFSAETVEPAIEIATTESVFLTSEAVVEDPAMDYALVEEAQIESTPVIETSIEEIAAVEMTDEAPVADVPLQVFEVTEQVPIEQTLETVMEQFNSPAIETLTVEELTHDSHPSTAPHQAPSDIIAEAASDGQIEESVEDTTE
jgi:hypothetical protein